MHNDSASASDLTEHDATRAADVSTQRYHDPIDPLAFVGSLLLTVIGITVLLATLLNIVLDL